MGSPLLKHSWQTVIKNDTGTAVVSDTAVVIVGSAEFNEKVLVGWEETVEIDCGSIDKTKIVSLFLTCDFNVAVATNAADATGGQAIDLVAGEAFAWNNTQPHVNPITQDITKIFVVNNDSSNASHKDATFRVGFLLDLIA